jgi:hypothetical protein
MNIMEIAILACIGLSIALQILIGRSLANIVNNSAELLDSRIAEALTTLVESNPLENSQVNPLQLMIMEIIKGQMQQKPIQVKEITREDDGKFGKLQ